MPTSAASSSAHSNVTPCWSDENSNVAVVDSDGSVGVAPRIVSGKSETVHAYTAGVGSTPPCRFFARTLSSCEPTVTSISYVDTQEPYSAPSSEHSNVACGSSDENTNSALVSRVDAGGPETTVVFGLTTVQLQLAGVVSTMPDV